MLIATAPSPLAAALRSDAQSLSAAVASWDGAGAEPAAVVAAARDEQRIIRVLAANPPLARSVERQVPRITSDVVARVDLNRLASNSPPLRTAPRVGPAPPVNRLRSWYRSAGRRFSIRWQLLAAVNFVESAFGRVRNTSGAGAQGPMQFLPATWRVYGLGGNVHDPHDAIVGAANYLAANGARRDERRALLRYNHSTLYADAVSRYASLMARDPDAFYGYYAWRVHFRRTG